MFHCSTYVILRAAVDVCMPVPREQGFSEVVNVPFSMRDFGEEGEGGAQREFLLMHLVPK